MIIEELALRAERAAIMKKTLDVTLKKKTSHNKGRSSAKNGLCKEAITSSIARALAIACF